MPAKTPGRRPLGPARAGNQPSMTQSIPIPSTTRFSHVEPGDTFWRGDGLRDFFQYRDLGVAAATGGRVVAHLVRAHQAPEKGTGWHRHEAEFQIVLMIKGQSTAAIAHA